MSGRRVVGAGALRMVLPVGGDHCAAVDGAGTRVEPGGRQGLRRGLRGPGPGVPVGSLTPMEGLAPRPASQSTGQCRSGRWCAPVSPSGSGVRPAPRGWPGTGSWAGLKRTPRRSLGSVTFLRTWGKGRRDRVVVAEDDIGGVTSLVTGLSRRLHRHRAGHAAPTPTRQTH